MIPFIHFSPITVGGECKKVAASQVISDHSLNGDQQIWLLSCGMKIALQLPSKVEIEIELNESWTKRLRAGRRPVRWLSGMSRIFLDCSKNVLSKAAGERVTMIFWSPAEL
jgi:hypothetical protein